MVTLALQITLVIRHLLSSVIQWALLSYVLLNSSFFMYIHIPSHIRDATDFIIRLKNLGRVPENSILATLDVSSLYTNIDADDGLAIIEEEPTKTGQTQPSAKTLTCHLEKVLKLNNFAFDNHNFIQVKGTAMGTRAATNFANVYMGQFEDTFVYRTEWYHYIIDWVRFIDVISFIWKGDESSLATFIK